jgi:hypothetical protein
MLPGEEDPRTRLQYLSDPTTVQNEIRDTIYQIKIKSAVVLQGYSQA